MPVSPQKRKVEVEDISESVSAFMTQRFALCSFNKTANNIKLRLICCVTALFILIINLEGMTTLKHTMIKMYMLKKTTIKKKKLRKKYKKPLLQALRIYRKVYGPQFITTVTAQSP